MGSGRNVFIYENFSGNGFDGSIKLLYTATFSVYK